VKLDPEGVSGAFHRAGEEALDGVHATVVTHEGTPVERGEPSSDHHHDSSAYDRQRTRRARSDQHVAQKDRQGLDELAIHLDLGNDGRDRERLARLHP
jgi:hypothetical protein